jgi:mycothiol synthase
MTEPATLPKGFFVRPPTMDDLQVVTDLIAARDIAEYGAPDFSLEDLRDEWEKPRFDLAADARLVVAPDGKVVGYEEVWARDPERLIGDGYVHPQFEGRGIGTYLLRWVESRAQEQVATAMNDGRIVFQATCSGVDDGGRNLFTAEAYTPIRHFWRMEITLNEPPLAPEWPAGIALRHFVPGQDDRAVHAAVDEAFGDHWGHTSSSFEEWARRLEHDDFDPELWFLALDGDQIAGVSLCRYRTEVAWVSTLAVRRPWRHNGLGLALLRHSFNEFYRRGERSIGLAVDSRNLTGATRLYQHAGMHVTRQYDTYAKVLRDA